MVGTGTESVGACTHVSEWIVASLACNPGTAGRLGLIFSDFRRLFLRASRIGALGCDSLQAFFRLRNLSLFPGHFKHSASIRASPHKGNSPVSGGT
jgi:hypothetical protein